VQVLSVYREQVRVAAKPHALRVLECEQFFVVAK